MSDIPYASAKRKTPLYVCLIVVLGILMVLKFLVTDPPPTDVQRKAASKEASIEAAKVAKVKIDETENLIKKHEVQIGMTADQCRRSWGKPSDINRTITAHGTHEQWVYNSKSYLYMEDGILTAVQN